MKRGLIEVTWSLDLKRSTIAVARYPDAKRGTIVVTWSLDAQRGTIALTRTPKCKKGHYCSNAVPR